MFVAWKGVSSCVDKVKWSVLSVAFISASSLAFIIGRGSGAVAGGGCWRLCWFCWGGG